MGAFYGATVTIQGSLMDTEPATWATLNDSGGTALTFTSAGIKKINEATSLVRPVITGATAGTDLDVYLLLSER